MQNCVLHRVAVFCLFCRWCHFQFIYSSIDLNIKANVCVERCIVGLVSNSKKTKCNQKYNLMQYYRIHIPLHIIFFTTQYMGYSASTTPPLRYSATIVSRLFLRSSLFVRAHEYEFINRDLMNLSISPISVRLV